MRNGMPSAVRTMRDIWTVIRLAPMLFTGLLVVIGSHLGGGRISLGALAISVGVSCCIDGAINTLNDVIDTKADRINAPSRPLASGRMSRTEAIIIVAIGLGLAAVGTWMMDIPPMYTLAPTMMGVLYCVWLKRVPVVGNLVVASITAYAVLFVPLQLGDLVQVVLTAFLTILVFMVGFELIKSIRDVRGDTAVGLRTLPAYIGVQRSALVAALLLTSTLVPIWSYDAGGSHSLAGRALVTAAVLMAVTVSVLVARRRMRAVHAVLALNYCWIPGVVGLWFL